MTGRLALAGIHPEETPLQDWTAVVFAVLVDLGASNAEVKGIDRLAAELERPILGEEIDAETWGATDEAQTAQRNLMSAFGIRPPDPDSAADDGEGDDVDEGPDGAA